ncbi:MAG: hypothetical protein WCB27_24390 [Thermoguttaceae bacterium]
MMNYRLRLLALAFIIHHSSFIIPPCLFAQDEVIRLPAVVPEEQDPPGQLVSHPNSSAQILQSPGDGDVAPATPQPGEPRLPPGVRNGFFQKALFDATWLAPGGTNGMGDDNLQLQSIFALPCPTVNSPLVITPGCAVDLLQGPKGADLPPRLYQSYFDFRWLSQVTPTLGLDLAITPGVFSDFDQESGKAFRLQGHGAAAWTCNETTKLVAGAAYLDRPDVELIAIGGVVWTPTADVKFDLIFPHPKISRRIYWTGQNGDDVQDWVYIAGEFNGDAWAIRRSDGLDDQVVISDYRLVLGTERRITGGLTSRFEIGYVFGRRIKYTSDTPDFHPSDTVMLRGGLTY